MASLSCRKSLVLVMVMVIIGGVQSGPRKIVRRQSSGIDTAHINNNDLIACFTAQADGKDCSNNINNLNDIPVDEVEAAPGCRCVRHNQCLDNNNPTATNTDGDGSLITLVNVRSTCIDPFDTCCTNIAQGPQPTPGPTEPYVSYCGQLKKLGVETTFAGFEENQAQYGQFPWMAAVMTTGIAGADGANVYVSGASLLHPRVVLTAAHYMHERQAQELAVRLGEWNFKFPTEPIKHQDIRVQRIVLHPSFSPNQLTYDVALLFLEEDAILGPTVDTICLPDPFEVFDRASCYSSGWGKDQFGQVGRYSEILKSLTLPVMNHQQCQNAYRGTRLGNTFNLHKTFMCAGGQRGVDTCTGDGGSPLVCPMKSDPSRYAQVGVVAWGIGCGTDGVPGVYASVSEAVDWIGQQLLTNMNFDIRSGLSKKR